MLCTLYLLSLLALTQAQNATGSPGCTSLVPVFSLPANGTSTVFASTTTTTSVVNCRGCSLVTSTYAFSITDPAPSPTTTTTLQSPPTTSTIFSCSQSPSVPPGATISFVPPPAPAPSNTTVLPALSAEAESLINDLKTVTLYASLIASDGFSDVICSGISPTSLSDKTGINGTAVLNEICFTAAIQNIDAPLYPTVVALNQAAIATRGVLETALFAVEAAAGYGGVSVGKMELAKLYREIDEVRLNNLFIGFEAGRGGDVKAFVGRKAGVV